MKKRIDLLCLCSALASPVLNKKILFCIAAIGLLGLMALPLTVGASSSLSFSLSLPSLKNFFSPLQRNLDFITFQSISLARTASFTISSLEQKTHALKAPLFAAASFPEKVLHKTLDLSFLLNEKAQNLQTSAFERALSFMAKVSLRPPLPPLLVKEKALLLASLSESALLKANEAALSLADLAKKAREGLALLPSKTSSFLAAAIAPKQAEKGKQVSPKQETQNPRQETQNSDLAKDIASLKKALALLKAQRSSFPPSFAKSLSALGVRVASLEKRQKQAISPKQAASDKQETQNLKRETQNSLATKVELEKAKEYLLTQIRFASNAIVGGYQAGGGAGTLGFYSTNRIENFTTDKALTASDTLLVKGNATLEKALTLQGDLSLNGASILASGKGTFTALHSPLLLTDQGDLSIKASTGIVKLISPSRANEIRVYENAASPAEYTSLLHGALTTSQGNFTITPSQNLLVSQGNVGIGTTSPSIAV